MKEGIFVMNKAIKKTILILTTLAMLCGLAGCDRSEASDADFGSTSSTSTVSDSADLSGTQAEFNFDEAVKDITLFGHKISLPCMWSDFGDDFSHDDVFIPADDDLSCGLLYKGKIIGVIFFGNCDIEHSYELETKPVVCITVGHYDYGYPYEAEELDWLDRAGYYSGLLEFSFGELTMESPEENIKNFLGDPSSSSEGYNCHYLVYDYDNGYLLFTINDEAKRNGRLLETHVYVNSK